MKNVYRVVSRDTREDLENSGPKILRCVGVKLEPIEPSNLPEAVTSFSILFTEPDLGAAEPFRVGTHFVLRPLEDTDEPG